MQSNWAWSRQREVLRARLAGLLYLGFGLLVGIPVHAQSILPQGTQFRINSDSTGAQASTSISSDAEGNFVVAWIDYGQSDSESVVFTQRFQSDGQPLGTQTQISHSTLDIHRYPSVSSNAAGDFVVVWLRFPRDGSGGNVLAQRFHSSGQSVGPELQVNTVTLSYQGFASVDSDADGDFIVVWHSYRPDQLANVYAQRFQSNGQPLGSEMLLTAYTSGQQRRPRVSSDAEGNFVVAWQSEGQDGNHEGIFAQRFQNNGQPLGAEFQVNTVTLQAQRYPSISSDAAGNFVVIWEGNYQDGSQYGIFARRYRSSGQALDSEFQVNTYTSGQQRFASISSDADGDFVVAWQSYGLADALYHIVAQGFQSNGQPLGAEFQVNTYIPNYQKHPSIDRSANGDFVVVWHAIDSSGSYEIFGQRYLMGTATATPESTQSQTPTMPQTSTPSGTWTPTATGTPTSASVFTPTPTWSTTATPTPDQPGSPTSTRSATGSPTLTGSPTTAQTFPPTSTPTARVLGSPEISSYGLLWGLVVGLLGLSARTTRASKAS